MKSKKNEVTKVMADLGKEIEDAVKKVATYKTRTKNDDIKLR